MRVTVLVENTPSAPGIEAEHGLSFYVEQGDLKILVDVGQKDLFASNAKAFGCDLAKVDFAVMSHGHGDHTGGLPAFRAINPHAPVYLARPALKRSYVRTLGIFHVNVGMPRGFVGDSGIVPLDGDLDLEGDIHLLTPLRDDEPLITTSRNLYMRKGLWFARDDFSHELAFVAREGKTSLVISSCSHTGLHNIMGRIAGAGLLGERTVVIAGMHLFDPIGKRTERDEVLDEFASRLLAFDGVEYLAGHCTGAAAFARLQRVMGGRICALRCGDRVEL